MTSIRDACMVQISTADPAKLKRKWESVKTAMLNLKVAPARVEKIVSERNLQALAKVVEELF